MFCPYCVVKNLGYEFCHACGKKFPCTSKETTHMSNEKEKSCYTGEKIKENDKKEKPITFLEFAKEKSTSWFKRTRPKSNNEKSNVVINIGLLGWHEKTTSFKPVRGKRVCLRLPSDAEYSLILSMGKKRLEDFYPDDIDEDEMYHVAFENGNLAYFIPGTTNDFVLSKYKEEIGQEYKNITMFLLSESNKVILEKIRSNQFNHENSDSETPQKKAMYEMYVPDPDFTDITYNEISCFPLADIQPGDSTQLSSHEAVVSDTNAVFCSNQEILNTSSNQNINQPTCSTDSTDLKNSSITTNVILKELSKKVQKNEQFFLNIQRNFSLQRILSLWGRQKKQSPLNRLMVKFIGETGIDSGALSKEFLGDLIKKIGEEMFPGGAPKESMSDIQNGNFYFCGQIMAVSLVEEGPPPLFLHESVYNLLVNNSITPSSLSLINFTEEDQSIFQQIRGCPEELSDFIIENGYTGVINQENIDTILHTIMISIVSRRRAYLEEVSRGLNLFGVYDKMVQNKEIMKTLFVTNNIIQNVDSNYLVSILQPEFSPDGSSQRTLEERIIDFLQDFIVDLEDNKVLPKISEIMATKDDGNETNICSEQSEVNITPDLTVKGLLGWLTGQKHRPLYGAELKITVKFEHNCYLAFPGHTICFPIVSACSKELTIPTQHCKSYEELKENLTTAYSSGQAFGRS